MMRIKALKKNVLADNHSNGFILPVLLITGVVITLMIAAVSSETLTSNRIAKHNSYAVYAQMTADAGLDYAVNRMNTVANWTGTGGEVTLLTNSTQNIKMTYQVVVNNGSDSSHKTLVVTARTYSPSTATSPTVTRKYEMDIVAVTSGNGPSSVSTGVGGLVLANNAKIAGGDVVIDGIVNMNNNSQIGLTTNPLNVRVADQACPISHGSGYPRVCDAAQGDTITNPIIMGGNAKIYADVIATNQTSGANMSLDGLQVGQSFAPVPLPPFDRTAFKNAVNASGQTMTGTQASTCSGNNVNWPANVKITGNISLPNNCSVKINGNAWISGSLTFGNKAQLAVQNSLGTTVPDIVVDGSAGVTISNNGTVVPNVSGSGVEIVTFWSADSSCSPDCSTLTGTNLYNSQNATTINLSNNGSAPASILYAYWSKVSIANNGQIGAVAGQTVSLSQNAVITFTSSIPGSSNLSVTWVKRGYMRIYQ